ncbi:MAG TPA: CHAT domain-containing tetratricopeptide repeat protein [Pyrinomonadaceae bacterium]|nr:CHAT domain-containing tetratricopeptide repeat protein [Pyrinomonadaceae bacterium]
MGERLSRNIQGGEKRSFDLLVNAGQLVSISVEQHGIILSVALFDPSGAQITVMDNPSGAHGPIYLSAIARESGTFRLDVRSTEDWSNAGTFEVVLSPLRQPTAEDDTRIQAETSFAKARDLIESASYEQAVAEYDRALPLWRGINDKHWESLTQFARGSAYRKWGKRKEAGDCFLEALQISNPQFETNDWRLKASALNDLGYNYNVLGETEKALTTLRLALDLYAAHGDRRGQASALNNLALTHLSSGELYSALPLLETALPFRQAENDRRGAINIINGMGAVYDAIGEPYEAKDYYLRALNGWQELNQIQPLSDPTNLATALNNVGIAHDKLGDSGVALEYYLQALEKFKSTDPNRAATLDNIGELYAAAGDGERAKQYYDQALSFWDTLAKPNVNLKANLLIHLGQYYFAHDDLPQALRFFQQAYELTTNATRRAEALTHIGAVLMLQNNPVTALDTFKRALEIQVNLKNPRGEAITRQKRGQAYVLLGQTFEAHEEFNRALSLWRLVQDSRGEAATLHSIAKVESDQQKLRDALQHSDQAIKIIESLRTKVSSRQLRISYFANQENYFALNADLNMRLYKATRDKTFVAAALEASEKSRARSLMDSLAETRINVTEGISAALLKSEQEIHQRVLSKSEAQTRLLSGKHSDSEAIAMAKDLVELIREDDDVRDRIRSTSPKYSQLTQPQPLVVAEIQKLLDDDTLLLEYLLGEKQSYAWVVSKTTIEGIELPGRQEIETTARRFITALTQRHLNQAGETLIQRNARFQKLDGELAAAASSLSRMLIDPVSPRLDHKRLLVVGDGVLQFVPFAALPAPQKIESVAATTKTELRPLIADYELISLASASALAVQRNALAGRKPAPRAVAVFADPVFGADDTRVRNARSQGKKGSGAPKQEQPSQGLASNKASLPQELTRALGDVGLERISWLPYSRDEALAIINVAPPGEAKKAIDFEASRATLTSKELSQYRILHFATHGIVDLENPQLSGIILSLVDKNGAPQDGYIRLHDIYNLNLPAELVVLSACDTGVGKQIQGEGLMTLTRGFMYAGAARVVASLWKVEDLATAKLMGKFYKEMFTNGRQPADALRVAQLAMSKDKQWQSPYYWAGFVLQGDWQ